MLHITAKENIDLDNFKYHFNNDTRYIINQDDYLTNCQQLIDSLREGRFTKVIYSRINQQNYDQSPSQLFNQLNSISPNTFNYLISIEDIGVWIGATPEKLISVSENRIKTTSIAGTKVNKDEAWGNKEIEEQAIVSRFISQVLSSNNCDNIKITGPNDLHTGVVTHLKTDFEADISFEKWKDIVTDLHPTPATCGLPKHEVFEFIKDFEPHDRSFYTGFLGPIDKHNVNLFVNLRCMSLSDQYAYLYLGGGITRDSNAEDEWKETENKAKTLLRVIHP